MAQEGDGLPRDRRTMFLLGAKRALGPIAEYLEKRLAPTQGPGRRYLRPPGAIQEAEFIARCYRCGNCVDVCPPRAVRPLSNGDSAVTGTPFIDPDLAACVICDALACTQACPSGALVMVPARGVIRMGQAQVTWRACARHEGVDCRACLDRCPMGADAIGTDEEGRIVIGDGCVGCGVCQLCCPVVPKAVSITPL